MAYAIPATHAGDCRELLTFVQTWSGAFEKLRSSGSKLLVERKVRAFDFEKYAAAREAFRKGPSSPNALPDVSLEEKIAWIEEHATEAFQQRFDLKGILEGRDWTRKRRLLRLFDSAQLHRGKITAGEMDRFVSRLYLIIGGPDPSLFDWLVGGRTDAIFERSLRRMLEARVMKEGLVRFSEANGWLRPPRVRERIRSFTRSNDVQFAMTALMTFSLVHGVPTPIVGPPIRWVEVPRDWIERALEEGFESAWPEARDTWLSGFAKEQAYAQANRVVASISTALVTLILWNEVYGEIIEAREKEIAREREMEGLIEELNRQTQEIREKLDQPKSVGEELWEQWRREWEKKNGRPVDPRSEEYRNARRVFLGQE